MAHRHCWALTHLTTDPVAGQQVHFTCVAPDCLFPAFSAPADSYLAALIAHDAGLPGPWPPPVPTPGADPLPARWPAPVPHDPERLSSP